MSATLETGNRGPIERATKPPRLEARTGLRMRTVRIATQSPAACILCRRGMRSLSGRPVGHPYSYQRHRCATIQPAVPKASRSTRAKGIRHQHQPLTPNRRPSLHHYPRNRVSAILYRERRRIQFVTRIACERSKQAALELGDDEDEAAFDEQLRQIALH